MHLSLKPLPYSIYFWPLVVLVYGIAAYFNIGYYHPDEHYQIIEFAGLKLGWNRPEDLAWEYAQAIRSSIQPWLCFVYFKLMFLIGIRDHYLLALSLRLLTAACSILVIGFFAAKTYSFFKPVVISKTFYYCCAYFLWFIPLVSVRFSSETWSGLLFTTALAFAVDDKISMWKYAAIGALLGTCFLFRFQCGILAASLIMWKLTVKKDHYKNILVSIGTLILVVIGGILLDYLFYGKLTLSFVNYFNANIIEDTASKYGVSSWSTLVTYILLYTIVPFGLLISASVLWLLIVKPGNPLIWCVVPFVLIHAIIPHKEIRFLFPLVWLAPCMIILMIEDLYAFYFKSYARQYRFAAYGVLTLLVLFNGTALFFTILKPAGRGEKYLTSYIDASVSKGRAVIYFSPGANPYQPWSFLPEHFYSNKNVDCRSLKDISTFKLPTARANEQYLLAIHEQERVSVEQLLLHKGISIKLIRKSLPSFELPVLLQYSGFNEHHVILLYSL